MGVRRYIVTTRLGGDYRWRPIDARSDASAIKRGQEIADEMASSGDGELWAHGALTIKNPDGEVIWFTLAES